MPAEQHPQFVAPQNADTPIWRYMDFTKFVSMLENGGLYFSRADLLGDPFEGSFPVPNVQLRPTLYKKFANNMADRLAEVMKEIYGQEKYLTYINCWHMNDHESAAMWRIYANSNEAIAIRSTFGKLHDALDQTCHVGLVRYIDYNKHMIEDGNALTPFLHKRLSYEHEKEVRAVTALPRPSTDLSPRGVPQVDPGALSLGVWKLVDLNSLIDEVYVAPSCQRWFSELVRQIVNRYSLRTLVRASALDDPAMY